MKLIIAIVQPESLQAVEAVVNKEAATLLSVSQVVGSAREPGYTQSYRGREVQIRRPKLRLEIAVSDSSVESVVQAVARVAAGGDSTPSSDGKIFVTDLHQCVNVRHGEGAITTVAM
ncbi:MAG TPA: P-II family nitrogen regulator [Gemmataceae bacterium]|nr:P-II family nitrogen regulator [Gemmataceae bacterium]